MIWLEYALLGFSLVLMVPVTVVTVQVLAATLFAGPTDEMHPQGGGKEPATCILMPAHNETLGIGNTLQKLLPMLSSNIRLLIVADNCSDDTADIVRDVAYGREEVEVIERHNAELRGKGYALDFGVRHLEADPPQVVLILDADCVFNDSGPTILAKQCIRFGRPIQALNLMVHSHDAGLKAKLAQFAWVVKNQVRALGDLRMGLPCLLMGTGMAFSWAQIVRAKLGTGHIVEDIKLGLELTLEGSPPMFCPAARVTSNFPIAADAVQTQRSRWEHGHLGVIFSEVPSAIWNSIVHRNWNLLAMALNLSVPPLALLTLLLVALIFATAIFSFLTGLFLPLGITLLLTSALAVAVLLAWRSYGQGIISLLQLSGVPLYVLSKVPVYFYFLLKRQSEWIRAKREGE